MPSCPSCGRDIGEGAAFCGYCGASAGGPGPGASPDAGTAQSPTDYWVCPSCSVENLAGDTFCSACGSAKPVASPAASTVTLPAAQLTPGASAGAGWACAACGAVNDLGAGFCWSCGTPAGGAGIQSAAGTAAAGVASGPPPPAQASHTGRWIAIAVAVALMAAAAVVGVVVVRNGGSEGGSASGAGTAQTAEQPLDGSTPTAGEAGSSVSAPVADDVTGYCTARSRTQLPSEGDNTYFADNLIDGDMRTCWAENVRGYGIGESVRFRFSPKMTLTKMQVMPGYKKVGDDWDRWYTNGRLRRITVTFSDDTQKTYRFDDAKRWQTCNFGEKTGSTVEFTIDAVYYPVPGDRHNAPDTSVSEVRFFGWPASEASQ